MSRIYSTFAIALFAVSFCTLNAGIIQPAQLTFDMNACLSEAANGTHSDYSELTALPSNNGAVRLSAASGSVYRQNPTVNPHSCTPGLDGTNAICIAVNPFCNYLPGSSEALRFDVLVEPLIGEVIRVEELNFQQKAPEMFNWVNGNTALNNYPTLYGIRILANNQVIYEEHDIPTTRDWNLETRNFHGNANFLVVAPTVFSFELLPYCSAGVVGFYSIWDLEDISVTAGCVNDCSEIVNGGEVFLMDGTFTYYGCEGDTEFEVQNNSTLNPQDFDYLITDENFNIIRVSESSANLNLNDLAQGTYFVYGYSGDGTTLIGNNINQITNAGCIELTSNNVTVLINKPDGGMLMGGPFEFCQNNQSFNFIPADAITLTGEVGTNSRWIITDISGMNVLAVPNHPSEIDFSSVGLGTCLIFHVSFDGWLKGLEVGAMLSDLESGSSISSTCYDLSNPIPVMKKQLTAPSLSGGPFSFCVGDGMADRINVAEIQFTAGSGQMNKWVATVENGTTILGIADNISDFDFDDAISGHCTVWNITYDNIMGLDLDANFLELDGCYAKSAAIAVNRYESQGGTITGGPFEFCTQDGIADYIPSGAIILSDNLGANSQWVVTCNGLITNLPTSYSNFNFDSTPEGICNLSHLSYSGNLDGLEIGNSLNNLDGCYKLSNQIVINKLDCTPTEGGSLTGGPFAFCTSDGESDMMMNVTISGTTGSINQWVITTDIGTITELITDPGQKNFEGSDAGVCFLRNISYEPGLLGLNAGNNINTDLDGKHGLSNSIEITKSRTAAGILDGGPYTFCVGDEEEDRIPQGDLTVTGNVGAESKWIATDGSGTTILAVGDSPNEFDFENAGSGNCFIYHISYNSISGLVEGGSVNDIDGCYSASNGVLISRIYVNGGILEGGPGYFSFCVGDGLPDFIPTGALSLTGNVGDTNTWVITNTSGTEILAIPNSPHDVDFESSLPGTCVLWSVSSTGPLAGLEVGENFLQIEGCHAKSTFISIFRLQNTPGVLTGGPFDFCVGDNMPDMIPAGAINITGNTGANDQWIITDGNGIIMDLPANGYEEFDFDSEDPGTAMIYLLSYDGNIDGLSAGMPITGLDGCFSLSNSLQINNTICPQPISGLMINEISANGLIELKNYSETSLTLENYWLCSYPIFSELTALPVACGEGQLLKAGESLFVKVDYGLSGSAGELALLFYDETADIKKMNHYVVWGSPDSNMTEQAIEEGMWTAGDMIGTIPEAMVLAYDGEGYNSADWSLSENTSCELSSNNDLASELAVKVYPNPATGKLNVQFSKQHNSTVQVDIISKLGKVLISASTSETNIVLDVDQLDSGMYFMRITKEGNSTTRTVVKI